ncbi:MAG: imidazolonepropionase [Ignavibacteria bacterium GWA2_55_11]|nr:MAG: imidazolonepropionase [Ignavibacteria bacterium GWA2_55_11]OGU46723.1 MAG: imidazolonepropionase [Ignavibacteria bacterium GWC2_56_12]OGU70856.1 MAG: imidazolonepropionase [Ignavibacteria bacterium RIFCSPLOWO2_12_FULL_56_21]OGU73309.1 MAG: imidazolonepropionase [Ignavibacteria bacterium RIFCSPLOWO2_02_FULL_55_14]HAV24424.1 imidazolonepropionase [Bacteroidota bacterium]
MVRQLLLHHIRQLLTFAGPPSPRRGVELRDIGLLTDASVLVENGKIAWVGPAGDLDGTRVHDADEIDCSESVVLPGLIDCHTHAMFAGTREDEFAQRSEGVSYQEIANRGGGILSTVKATRAATKRELKRLTARRLDLMMQHGTTTMEIKSGYGLNEEAELKMLEAIRELQDEHPATVVATFLGAHAVPPEYEGRSDEYITLLIERILPYIAKRHLAAFCDVFCENGYFTTSQSNRLLSAAAGLGLGVRLHADQLHQIGASALGAELSAHTVDHLERIDDRSIAALRSSGTIGVILPGASFFLGGPYAPARKLIDSGVPIAIASNFNPGSCMSFSLPLMTTIACTQTGVTPEEALSAVTVNAAVALGISDRFGSIDTGKEADFVMFDVPSYRSISYEFGTNLVSRVIKRGVLLEFP